MRKFAQPKVGENSSRPFGTLSFKAWQKIKTNCDVVLHIDDTLAMHNLDPSADTDTNSLLHNFNTKIDRKHLLNTITLIAKCIELSGDASEDRATIQEGVCPQLDELKLKYAELDNVMSAYITQKLIPDLRRMQRESG